MKRANRRREVGRELQNPFIFYDGSTLGSAQEWARRRREIHDLILPLEYGDIPPAAGPVSSEELYRHEAAKLDGASHRQYRLRSGPRGEAQFILEVFAPAVGGRLPVILDGDGCWRLLTDQIILEVVRRGYLLAQFNRVELAVDADPSSRRSGLYALFPDREFGALAAWAWGFHRCVDVLSAMPFVDARRIIVTGHSRGGKAALLAGATDGRIALTAPNGSGCGGAGSFLWLGEKCENLADILGAFPHWFSPRLREYLGSEHSLPFDQHYLKALVAPRALLATEALGDLWANPSGTWLTHEAAREVYRLLSVDEQIGIAYRDGGHDHTLEDWSALLDFADWRLRGIAPRRSFHRNPFPRTPRAFSWTAPGA
jgi:hypothetical protein